MYTHGHSSDPGFKLQIGKHKHITVVINLLWVDSKMNYCY